MTTVTGKVVDLDAARAFLAAHGRLLDRRRRDTLFGADPSGVLAALDGYRNPDGGFGWGLEPDLRSPESQPTAAMHAFEVLAEVAPTTLNRSVELCDWLDAHDRPDGGLPLRRTDHRRVRMRSLVAQPRHRHLQPADDRPGRRQRTSCRPPRPRRREPPLAREGDRVVSRRHRRARHCSLRV